MILLMDDTPLAKTSEIHDKVVAKSKDVFTISADRVCQITLVAR